MAETKKDIRENILTFLKKRPLISINQLEKICGIYQRNLGKYIRRERPMPLKYVDSLAKELKKYGFTG